MEQKGDSMINSPVEQAEHKHKVYKYDVYLAALQASFYMPLPC